MIETITSIYYNHGNFETLIETETHYYELRGDWTEGLAVGDTFVKNESNNARAILSPDKWYEVSSVLIRPAIGLTVTALIVAPDRQKVVVVIPGGIDKPSKIRKVKLTNIKFKDGEFFADIHGTFCVN